MKIKNILILILVCGLIFAINFFFNEPIVLMDILQGAEVKSFHVEFPFLRRFIEPFYAFAFYMLTLSRLFYVPALISWVSWILIAVVLFCLIKKYNLNKSIIKIVYALVFFASMLIFVAVLPMPGPKLIKPVGFLGFDPHSHTNYSHDNISIPFLSKKFHEWAGFDGYYMSEHNHSDSFDAFSDKDKFKVVYPAMQMQSSEGGISLLLLSQKKFDAKQFENLSIEELISKAHQNNMLAIMPHWWKWKKPTLQELKNWDIDGFEIYNCGYRNLDDKTQKTLIDFVQENELLGMGSTDWHGWGYMTDVWTVLEENKEYEKDESSENYEADISTTAEYDKEEYAATEESFEKYAWMAGENDRQENLSFQISKKPPLKVILYRQKQSNSIVRFIFEPFFALYYYLKAADIKMTISFIIWLVILFVFFNIKISKVFLRGLPLFLFFVFIAMALYFLIIFIPVYHTNKILFFNAAPAALGMSVLWLIVWIINKKQNAKQDIILKQNIKPPPNSHKK